MFEVYLTSPTGILAFSFIVAALVLTLIVAISAAVKKYWENYNRLRSHHQCDCDVTMSDLIMTADGSVEFWENGEFIK